MFERMNSAMKNAMRSWLNIEPARDVRIRVDELLNFESNAFLNRIWYRGESTELIQVHKQLRTRNFGFWESVPTNGQEIRKIHTGLPKIIVNTLTNATLSDMNEIEFENDELKAILEENNFEKLLEESVKKALYLGDGAFKISIDASVSDFPIIEFIDGDRVELLHKRGRLYEVIFKTEIRENRDTYILYERYGFGSIAYELYDQNGKQVPLAMAKSLVDLIDVEFDERFMMAMPFSIFKSEKWEGRGQSLFDSKRDNFDALDEAWSQWMDALRSGRTKTYIPQDLIPRDYETGALIKPNAFDNRYIATGVSMNENGQSKITVEQTAIPHDSYLQTYITALDLCLQGIISPSTLGIDAKKIDNAEAQREKEKATLYTRNSIVKVLQADIPKLLQIIQYTLSTMRNQTLQEELIQVGFGEFANPSFESQVETVGKAKMQGIMSIEAVVDELYGDSKDEDWKAEEVQRLKNEQGIIQLEEPAIKADAKGAKKDE